MELGIAPAYDLGFSEDERVALVREAASLGYTQTWTNAMAPAALDLLGKFWDAVRLPTGTNVIATPGLDLAGVAAKAKALGERTGGRFILGIGGGHIGDPAYRARNGLGAPIATMRSHIEALRAANVPIYLAAMGPQMLRLAGEAADGALPNWMDPPQLAWARARMAEGAAKAGRDPRSLRLVQFIRVTVDDDPAVARHSLAKNALVYAMGGTGVSAYRAAMTRMGLDLPLTMLEAKRDAGATPDQLADLLPDDVLRRLGAW
ncbi:MAG: LLM class flavin-dependent oxidoreductase, partial [Chloroflexi bacterium]|nr:LLM class flavin-dependent oxidoreductase [Chloroflexota bacterium]